MTTTTVQSLYTSDAYIENNPGVHEEDSPWKVGKILPFINRFAAEEKKERLTILDVGGGAGIILREVAAYLATEHKRVVTKYCLDLSPGILVIQARNNPDAVKVMERDIVDTGLANREVDVTMMIDVLEHVEQPEAVLREIARISRYALFKVPLEDTIFYHIMDFFTRGRFRQRLIEKIGHINVFNAQSLATLLEANCGHILSTDYTNVYSYLLSRRQSPTDRLFNLFGNWCATFSPTFAARIFNDYLIVLVRCGE